MGFRCMRNKRVEEPRISEVLIHMDAFPKPAKTNGKKKIVSEILFNPY